MLFDSYKFIDLTHLLTPNIPTWDNTCGFTLDTTKDYDPHGFRVHKIHMQAGVGTHMDAPCHFFKGQASIDDIPLEQLIVQTCVIQVAEKADANYLISLEDIENYEKQYGRIPPNSFVIGYTGWSKHWPDSKSYLNVDQANLMHFPSFSLEAIKKLLEKEIVGIGIDTLSPDCDLTFPIHKLLLGSGKYIIENMANCHLMPPHGAYVILLPLNMDSSESPIRAIGICPKTNPPV